jgi:hypothetical protein
LQGTATHPGARGGDSRIGSESNFRDGRKVVEPQEGRQPRERQANLAGKGNPEESSQGRLRPSENLMRGGAVKAVPCR